MRKIYANYVTRQSINSHPLSRCTSTENFKFILYLDIEIFEGVQSHHNPLTVDNSISKLSFVVNNIVSVFYQSDTKLLTGKLFF